MSRLERYRETVALTLKDRNPEMWTALRTAGELDAYLTEFARMLVEAFQMSYERAMAAPEIRKLEGLELAGALNALEKEIEEAVFAELLEFPQEDPEGEDSGEPEVPPEIVAMFEQMSAETAAELLNGKAG